MKNSLLSLKEKAKIGGFLSRQALTNSLLVLTLLLISSQLTKFWWPDTALVNGVRVDYLAPSISLTDIMMICYLISKKPRSATIILKPLILFIAISLLISLNPIATLFFGAKLILYSVFVLSIDIRKNKKILLNTLFLGLLLQLTLAVSQFRTGSSVGSYAFFLGERNISSSSPNVAKSEVFGRTLLRAYGTFSHPNTLAGWTTVVVFIFYVLRATPVQLLFSLTLGTTIITLTQSRTAFLAYFFLLIPIILKPKKRRHYLFFLIISIFLVYPTVLEFFARHPEAIIERIALFKSSIQLTALYPLFGTGLNSTISAYPLLNNPQTLLQPDHVIPTLLLSQIGVFGLISIFILRGKLLLPSKKTLFLLTPLFLLDHYFLTSPQGMLILLLLWRIDISTGSTHAKQKKNN